MTGNATIVCSSNSDTLGLELVIVAFTVIVALLVMYGMVSYDIL